MTTLTIAERSAATARELGLEGRIAPVPFNEGADRVRRCTACGHITRSHWYDSDDPRFEGRTGTRWCQVCTAFCPLERCTTKRGRARAPARSPVSPPDCRAVESYLAVAATPPTTVYPPVQGDLV